MDLKRIIQLLKSKSLIIFMAVLVGTTLTVLYSKNLVEPVYEASSELILTSENSSAETIDYNTLLANEMLIQTYREIANTPRLMEEVARVYPELGMSVAQLSANVTSTSTMSQIMSISARADSYAKAARIANAVAVTLLREVPQIMNLNNLSLLNPATEEDEALPVKPRIVVNAAIGFILSFLFAVTVIFLREYLRDDIRSASEAEQVLGLPALASLPRMRKDEVYPIIRIATQPNMGESMNEVVQS